MEKSLNEETYDKLKYDIMTFKLAPGDLLSAQKIATRYDVSRTPAREAIVKLEKENLIKIVPQAGSYVAKINTKRASNEWFVRMSLEVGMVDKFFENVTENDIKNMEMLNERLVNYDSSKEDMSRVEIDNELHYIIYNVTGEELAVDILKTQMSHYNRIRYLAELNQKISHKTDDEHQKLIDAAKNKDKEAYLNIIKEHIRRILGEQDNLRQIYPDYFE